MGAAIDVCRIAEQQLRDYDEHTPGTTFNDAAFANSLSESQAYAIQAHVGRLREARGDQIIGYKVGCTSPGLQRQLGIDHPVYGRLYATESWASGARLVAERFDHLAIEGELGVRLRDDLSTNDSSQSTLAAAVESVFAVIELHNFVFRQAKPSAAELIANNAIHAGFVYAQPPGVEWTHEPGALRIEMDGKQVAAASGTGLTALIFNSLRWLGNQGIELCAGQTVLCGSVAPLLPLAGESAISVITDRFGSVHCRIG